jgi:segregation and condensation protein B
LSAPALETLAVIAYRQPVPRADIEAIRGVNCGEILRQLMERDLVRISGRGEDLGRPYLYSTTKRFLEIFGLVQLDELPRADALRSLPLPASPPPLGALVIAEESSPDSQYDSQADDLDYDTAQDAGTAEDTDEPESLEE